MSRGACITEFYLDGLNLFVHPAEGLETKTYSGGGYRSSAPPGSGKYIISRVFWAPIGAEPPLLWTEKKFKSSPEKIPKYAPSY